MKTVDIKIMTFSGSILLCLAIGAVSGIISGNSMNIYESLNLPELQPPGYLFPVMWTVLYILMGFALYRILILGKSVRESRDGKIGLLLFGLQLLLNFCWSPIFFVYAEYLLAFVWIVILWVTVVLTAFMLYRIDRIAGYLMLPYIAWVTFATYLSYGVYVLN